ncbi:hypothetical protein TcasGA2_TC000892 [Tribolium castaneum]|uniref:Uncharacterized protein n=1 Tax=Tribolium castaneum TaxID=7070 RepID=D6W910_TRICA|nr:hypothetical protein TcasGA2_TC000892 [Tribolium castaneum]
MLIASYVSQFSNRISAHNAFNFRSFVPIFMQSRLMAPKHNLGYNKTSTLAQPLPFPVRSQRGRWIRDSGIEPEFGSSAGRAPKFESWGGKPQRIKTCLLGLT